MHGWSIVTAVGFWLGTILPVFYLPVFIAGIDSVETLTLLLALLIVHALALVVGHEYDGSRTQ
ncbi:hypothetical protein CV102_00955 [Natronococcus pandeyae]|uniref:Uncharacterized protein n=1 Tax=Natronococcus pandeyae TaxID=2055836 RepID=A0A8J8Q472_9EURY|nr:hypothetical protein [Natronococcus pandeyae]TYL40181.1 hypothetical protein CV102_00955 [Natronococcus pandeyae]